MAQSLVLEHTVRTVEVEGCFRTLWSLVMATVPIGFGQDKLPREGVLPLIAQPQPGAGRLSSVIDTFGSQSERWDELDYSNVMQPTVPVSPTDSHFGV